MNIKTIITAAIALLISTTCSGGAKVTKGFSIYEHEVRTEKAKVEKWINGLK